MKILERIALIIFSIIIFILAIISCLVVLDVVSLNNICDFLNNVIENETVSRTVIIVSVICILLAIKSLFFPTKNKKKEEIKSGVLLENKDGRLLISKDTIESLIISIVRSFDAALDIQTKIHLDVNNNITVYISLLVREDAVIKELSANIQSKIKEIVKKNTDLEVSQININVKNIDSIKQGNGPKYLNSAKEQENSIEKIKQENIEENQTKEEKIESEITRVGGKKNE